MEIWGKTPKSWLTEVCAKKRLQSVAWVYQELQKNPTKFMSTCVITRKGEEDIKVDGIGSSKKEAEHDASQKALAALNVTRDDLFDMTPTGKKKKEEQALQKALATKNTTLDVVDNDILSNDDDDDDLSGAKEPIGDLITLCRRNKIQAPLYEEVHEYIGGPANINMFTVTCSVAPFSSKSVQRPKKIDAKKISAFKVLKELEGMGYHLAKTPKSLNIPPLITSTADSSDMDSVSSSSLSISISSSSSSDLNEYSLREMSQCFSNEEKSTNCSSSSSSLSSINLTSTGVTLMDGNPLKRELDTILAKKGHKGNSSVEQSSNLEEDHRMQIDIQIENLKRKLLAEEEDELNADSKRKWLPARLGCQIQDNNCLQFISNYCHIFQHLPTGSTVENALGMEDLMRLIKEHGGALTVLQKEATKLKIKMKFTTSTILQKSNGEVVFLKMKLPRQYDPIVQRELVVNGVGKTNHDAKVNAAFEALAFLNLMIKRNNLCDVPPPNIPYTEFPCRDFFL